MTYAHRTAKAAKAAPAQESTALKAEFGKILQAPKPYHEAGNTQAGKGPSASLNDRLAAALPNVPADQRDRLIAAVDAAGSYENLPEEYQKML